MNMQASSLSGPLGERVALCKVAVSAVLADLLAEVSVTQTYRNEEDTNIEATYTFPLPVDAVLLSLDVALGGRRLQGVVVEKSQAEERYEEAIEEGDAAVLLENPEPGLYTMNVGNLLAGETAIITVRYALLHRWNGDRLRFHVPSTIAPRYGKSPLAPHQAPEHSLSVENHFSIDIEVTGALRNAQFDCPTHALRFSREKDEVRLSLAQERAAMDRDLVLNIRTPDAERNVVMTGQDGEGMAAIASFLPFFPGLRKPATLDLVIVVDCSGSMAGDSIDQAKLALDGILGRLQAGDSLNLIAFGSDTNTLSPAMLPCTPANLEVARHFAGTLDANLGGTEIEAALLAAGKLSRGDSRPDIFLITDGEVGDWQPVAARAREAGIRIFTFGVGSAVSEAFVRKLASATGGECELVTPNEGMADRVVRHFERMRAPRAKRAEIRWPEGATDMHPARLGSVFEGDTVTASARFERLPARGEIVLEIEFADGSVGRQTLPLPDIDQQLDNSGISTVARVAAAARTEAQDDAAALATALRYQLVGPFTDCLVVAERAEDEKSVGLPQLRKVPQTMAAGWGGLGTASMLAMPAIARVMSTTAPRGGEKYLGCAGPLPEISTYDDIHEQSNDWLLPYFEIELLRSHVRVEAPRINAREALKILVNSGVWRALQVVWSRAEAMGLPLEDAAAIILDHLLRSQFASDELDASAKVAVAALTMEVEDLVRRFGPVIATELRSLTDEVVQESKERMAQIDIP
jgi:Ca-activated chloride channel family protein